MKVIKTIVPYGFIGREIINLAMYCLTGFLNRNSDKDKSRARYTECTLRTLIKLIRTTQQVISKWLLIFDRHIDFCGKY